jgi:peptidoglycan/LPS O-acetylase OafA/YrhL
MIQNRPRGGADRILLLEALLALILFALFLLLYFVPAGEATFEPAWWAWPVLAGLFFGILLLDQWRRKRRAKSGLSNALPEGEVAPPEELP